MWIPDNLPLKWMKALCVCLHSSPKLCSNAALPTHSHVLVEESEAQEVPLNWTLGVALTWWMFRDSLGKTLVRAQLKHFHLCVLNCPSGLLFGTMFSCPVKMHWKAAALSIDCVMLSNELFWQHPGALLRKCLTPEDTAGKRLLECICPKGHVGPAPLRDRRQRDKAKRLPVLLAVPIREEGDDGVATRRSRNRQKRKLSKGNLILDTRPGNSL